MKFTLWVCAAIIALLVLAVSLPAWAQQHVMGQAQYRALINNSKTVTLGLTYQTLLSSIQGATPNSGASGAAGLSQTTQRQSLEIENNNVSGTDTCYIIIGSTFTLPSPVTTSSTVTSTISGATMTAAQASITLGVGASYTRYWPYVPPDQIIGTCTTTGDSIYVDVQ
jgi:hypothetical protein